MTAEITAFANRIEKNARHRMRWARREAISCYRIYDCDVPAYPVIIDWYQTSAGTRLHLQEVDTGWQQTELEHRAWTDAMAGAVATTLGVDPKALVIKRRVRQRVGRALDAQYQASGLQGEDLIVREGGHQFLVNLEAYLDTGLFLDHRLTRAMVGRKAHGCRFLNLFAYTGSFTVYAAKGGASSSVTVDLSNTYCAWAERNLALNAIDPIAHQVVRADVFAWLKEAAVKRQRFDLIVLDPPSFSNSKRMQGVLDVQRDHAALITACMGLLSSTGTLFFSCNLRSFTLDAGLASRFRIADISSRTVPEDFRDRRIHQCYTVNALGPAAIGSQETFKLHQ
jgi:23S rRNA (cytosine1962-C5)-methyltransferase